MLKKEYFVDFYCKYDLRSYPFDFQICHMIFQLEEFNSTIVLEKEGETGIEFLGEAPLCSYFQLDWNSGKPKYRKYNKND